MWRWKLGNSHLRYCLWEFIWKEKKLNIPGLGLKGNNWLGPICLSWKTLRTSSHLFALPSPDPQQHARRKTQWTHSASILIKSRVYDQKNVFKKNKWVYLEVEVSPKPRECQLSGESTFLGWASTRVAFVFPSRKRCGLTFKSTRRDKVTAVRLVGFKEASCPSWLDRQ